MKVRLPSASRSIAYSEDEECFYVIAGSDRTGGLLTTIYRIDANGQVEGTVDMPVPWQLAFTQHKHMQLVCQSGLLILIEHQSTPIKTMGRATLIDPKSGEQLHSFILSTKDPIQDDNKRPVIIESAR